MANIIRLNNSGVTNLEAGRYREALIDFREAADLTHSGSPILMGAQSEVYLENADLNRAWKTSSTHRSSNADAVPTITDTKHQTSHSEQHMQSTNTMARELGSDMCFLRRSAFRIPLDDDQPKSFTKMCTILLFNMALCYHISFCQSFWLPNGLQNASTLYNMAGSIAISNVEDHTLMKVLIATLNNLGYLSFELGDFEQSRDYFNELRRCVLNLDPNDTNSENIIEREEVLLNTMVLRDPHAAKAA